ncbi:unnamed protein product [Ectocarpus sp. 12 AP-2014]
MRTIAPLPLPLPPMGAPALESVGSCWWSGKIPGETKRVLVQCWCQQARMHDFPDQVLPCLTGGRRTRFRRRGTSEESGRSLPRPYAGERRRDPLALGRSYFER